jgi:hypothetical protein
MMNGLPLSPFFLEVGWQSNAIPLDSPVDWRTLPQWRLVAIRQFRCVASQDFRDDDAGYWNFFSHPHSS